MFPLALTLSTLSLLVLAAHFLRYGDLVQCVAMLVIAGMLLFVRRRWVLVGAQVVLVLAAIKWVFVTNDLVSARVAVGGEAGRLAAILWTVVAVNVLAALALGTRAVTARYPGGGPSPPAAR